MTTFLQQVEIDFDRMVSMDLKQLFEKRDGGHLLAERFNNTIKDEDITTKCIIR
jgi:ribosome biogenesis SPOUT family RNA methylase Rps3